MSGDIQIQQVMFVKSQYEDILLEKANVVSVGVGFREKEGQLTDEVVLVVNVERKQPETILPAKDIIPASIEGVPVDVREVGFLRALSS